MRNGSFGSALAIALGLAVAGIFVGQGFIKGRAADRYVTVKGISERDVKADIALWPINFVSTDDDLDKAQSMIEEDKAAILAFLDRHGIETSEVELQKLEVTDVLANPYRSGPAAKRYIISQTLMVRSEDVERIQAAGQKVGELVEAGVVLSTGSGYGGGGPTFLFTRLSDIKPEMIKEATANARKAAQQFAADSGSRLGGIRQANQGVFVILPRDRATGIMEENQLNKTVRVVSTVEYYLKD
jgi:hypothetical protein